MNTRLDRKLSGMRRTRGSMIALTALLSVFVVLPLSIFTFEVVRVNLAKQQLKTACDSAALAGALALRTGDPAQRTERVNQAGITYLRRNSVCNFSLERAQLGASDRPVNLGECVLTMTINDQDGTITANAKYGMNLAFGAFLGLNPFSLTEHSKAATAPKQDMIIVFDCSGSMRGVMTGAQNTLRSFINDTRSGDEIHFGLVAYASTVGENASAPTGSSRGGRRNDPNEPEPEESASAQLPFVPLDMTNDQASAVLDGINRCRVIGETNTPAALDAALEMVNGSAHRVDADKVIILVTDGLPMVSRQAPSWTRLQTLARGDRAAQADVTLHSIGFFHSEDRDLGPALLQQLRQRAGGESKTYTASTVDELQNALRELISSNGTLIE